MGYLSISLSIADCDNNHCVLKKSDFTKTTICLKAENSFKIGHGMKNILHSNSIRKWNKLLGLRKLYFFQQQNLP